MVLTQNRCYKSKYSWGFTFATRKGHCTDRNVPLSSPERLSSEYVSSLKDIRHKETQSDKKKVMNYVPFFYYTTYDTRRSGRLTIDLEIENSSSYKVVSNFIWMASITV